MKDFFCVFLDAGHGGLDKSGKYVTAPGKQFQHTFDSFHRDGWFYEGVWNRVLTNRVYLKLVRLDIPVVLVSHEYLDTPLEYRVDMANWYARSFRHSLYISNHANASRSHRARGFELYTSPGKTDSDSVAGWHWKNVHDLLEDRIRYRDDLSDGDHDKEARFFVLVKTVMPAMLVEHLFFDNENDARLLMDDEIIDRFAEAQVRTVINYIKSL